MRRNLAFMKADVSQFKHSSFESTVMAEFNRSSFASTEGADHRMGCFDLSYLALSFAFATRAAKSELIPTLLPHYLL